MHEAKADWLYGLKAWNKVLPPEEQQRLTKEYRTSKIVRHEKIGRNDPCPCGSGKKIQELLRQGGLRHDQTDFGPQPVSPASEHLPIKS